MALIKHYLISKCCQLVFGSYLQLLGVEGALGPAYIVLALGVQFMTMNPTELAAFKERIEGENKLWLLVGKNLDYCSKFQVIEFVSDEGKRVVCVKKWSVGEGSTVAEWRKSPFLGGSQLDPGGTVPVVLIDNPNGRNGDHAFVEVLIKNCSRKLAAVGACRIVCVRCGLNDDSHAIHLVSASDPSRALLDIITPVRTEAFVSTMSRSRALYAPPTRAQHSSTVKMLRKLSEIGSEALVHQKKNKNSLTNSQTQSVSRHAAATDDKAVAFVIDVLKHTIGERYGVCQSGNDVPITPMQRATATLISDPDGVQGRDAMAYLTPRVGAAHVDVLKGFGRELAQNENEILALAPAASGSRPSKRHRA